MAERITVKHVCIYCDYNTEDKEQSDLHMQEKHPEIYQLMQEYLKAKTPEEKAEAFEKARIYKSQHGRFHKYLPK